MLKLTYGILLSFCGAILVHISIIFLIPRLSDQRVTAHLQAGNPAGDVVILSGSQNNSTVRGLDPFFRYRVCFFDLNDGAFQLVSNGTAAFFSANLLSQSGEVLFSITDRQTINRKLNVEVRALAEQQRLSQVAADETALASAVPVYVPVSNGYAIVRAFVPDQSWSAMTDEFLTGIECQPVPAGN